MKKLIIQLFKFGVVGVIALLIDVGVLMLLKEVFSVPVLVASAVSFCVSITVNYSLSMLFVFESKDDNKIKEFVFFVLLSIGGLILNQIIMWLGIKIFDIYYLAAKVFAVFVVAMYNFITRKIFLEKR